MTMTEKTTTILYLSDWECRAIQQWAQAQPDKPDLARAAQRLILFALGLKAAPGPLEPYIPPPPPVFELGPRSLEAIGGMIAMALPRPIVVLPTDTKPSDEIKLDGSRVCE